MSYSLAAALLLPLAAPALGFAPPAGLPPLATPAVQEELARLRAAVPRREGVRLQVWPLGGSVDIHEPFWRVDLRGYPAGAGRHSFSGFAGSRHLSFDASPERGDDPRKGFRLWGGEVSVSVREFGGGWSVWGSVGRAHVNANLRPWGSGYEIWGLSGAHLRATRSGQMLWVDGDAEPGLVDPAVLGVLGAAFAVLEGKTGRAEAAEAAQGPVRAAWRARSLRGGPRRERCAHALSAVKDALDLADARDPRTACSWNYGLRADWESLEPLRPGEEDAEAVEASWRSASFQKHMAGGDCFAYLEALDEVLARLPVRKVRQTVSCAGGSGFVSLGFEYLSAR